MEARYVEVFLAGIHRYFAVGFQSSVSVGAAYLIGHQDSILYDYTGVIGISGSHVGNVYFSATHDLLMETLMAHGESQCDDPLLFDLVGEIANTIAGNAREHLGKDFMISTPFIMKGKPEKVGLQPEVRAFAIPLEWQQSKAVLVVSLRSLLKQ